MDLMRWEISEGSSTSVSTIHVQKRNNKCGLARLIIKYTDKNTTSFFHNAVLSQAVIKICFYDLKYILKRNSNWIYVRTSQLFALSFSQASIFMVLSEPGWFIENMKWNCRKIWFYGKDARSCSVGSNHQSMLVSYCGANDGLVAPSSDEKCTTHFLHLHLFSCVQRLYRPLCRSETV